MFLKYNVPTALCEQCTVRRVTFGRAQASLALRSLNRLLEALLRVSSRSAELE